MVNYNEKELEAITTAFEMPAYSESDRFFRKHAVANLDMWLLNQECFEKDDFSNFSN